MNAILLLRHMIPPPLRPCQMQLGPNPIKFSANISANSLPFTPYSTKTLTIDSRHCVFVQRHCGISMAKTGGCDDGGWDMVFPILRLDTRTEAECDEK